MASSVSLCKSTRNPRLLQLHAQISVNMSAKDEIYSFPDRLFNGRNPDPCASSEVRRKHPRAQARLTLHCSPLSSQRYAEGFHVQYSYHNPNELTRSDLVAARSFQSPTLLHGTSLISEVTPRRAASIDSPRNRNDFSHGAHLTPLTKIGISPRSLHGWIRVSPGSVGYADLTKSPGIRSTRFRKGIVVTLTNKDSAIIVNADTNSIFPTEDLDKLAKRHGVRGDVRVFGAANSRRWFDVHVDMIVRFMERYALTLPTKHFTLLPTEVGSQTYDNVILMVSKQRGVILTGIPDDRFPLIKAHYASPKGSSPISYSLSSSGVEASIHGSPTKAQLQQRRRQRSPPPNALPRRSDLTKDHTGTLKLEDVRSQSHQSSTNHAARACDHTAFNAAADDAPAPPSPKGLHRRSPSKLHQGWIYVSQGAIRLANLSRVKGIATQRICDGGIAVALLGGGPNNNNYKKAAIVANLDTSVPNNLSPLETLKQLAIENDINGEAYIYLPHKGLPGELEHEISAIYGVLDELKVKYRMQVKYQQLHFPGEAKMEVTRGMEVWLQVRLGRMVKFGGGGGGLGG